jgi:hypothetical protein
MPWRVISMKPCSNTWANWTPWPLTLRIVHSYYSNLLCPRIERSGAYSFWPVHLSVCLSVSKDLNIGHIFWMVSDRDFICVFLMTRPFNWYQNFDLVTLTLKFDPLFKNFNIGCIFWMVSDRAFIFYMCVPYDKNFLMVPQFFTLWPWRWSLAHYLITFTGHIFWMV